MSSTFTDANRQFWRSRTAVRDYQNYQGWLDDGERVAFEAVASEVRGLPLLDIGVGAGRTTSLLRLLTDDYVGIDWSPEMVDVCRSMHPGVDIRQGDARDLSAFASSTIKCVVFSFNGLDSIADHEERGRVVAEVHRVLRSDGIFAYSTLSMHGRCFRQLPWHPAPWRSGGKVGWMYGLAPRPERLVRFAVNSLAKLPTYPRLYADWWHSRKMTERHSEWATAPLANHNFRLLHFSTIEGEHTILREHGFRISDAFSTSGDRIDGNSEMPSCPWFFVVARKIDA
jgi:SAM-dependent methyltransferase